MSFSTKKIVTYTAGINLIFFLAGFLTEAKAEEGQKTTFEVQTLALGETFVENGTFGFMADKYPRKSVSSPAYSPYTRSKKSSMSHWKQAPAYRLRETPKFALSTNMLHNLSSSLNLGAEVGLEQKITLQMPVTLNPWTYNREENVKSKFLLLQPELRYWTCEAFDGHFFGLHAHYAYFNVGGLGRPPFSDEMNQHRNEGHLAGAGVSYGFVFPLSPRWGMEANIGFGFAKLWYDRYPCQKCAKQFESQTRTYWGITRAGFSFVYYIF